MDTKTKNREILAKKIIYIRRFYQTFFFTNSQIGMVKSPVEGSTVALVRLQTPVVYSDFVRPVCLPDDDFTRNSIITDYPTSALTSVNLIDRPRAEKFYGKKTTFHEDRQFFKLSDTENLEEVDEDNQPIYQEIVAAELIDEHMNALLPQAQFQARSVSYYEEPKIQNVPAKHQWKQCNTLGWSRQKEHLQRVQLNTIDMKSCENISIATVNSLCAEAAYHKQDCNVSNLKTGQHQFLTRFHFNFKQTGRRICWKSNHVPSIR